MNLRAGRAPQGQSAPYTPSASPGAFAFGGAPLGLVAWDGFFFTVNRNHANDKIMIIRTSISPCLHRSRSRGAQRPARGFAGEAGVIGAAVVRLRCAALLAGGNFSVSQPVEKSRNGIGISRRAASRASVPVPAAQACKCRGRSRRDARTKIVPQPSRNRLDCGLRLQSPSAANVGGRADWSVRGARDFP